MTSELVGFSQELAVEHDPRGGMGHVDLSAVTMRLPESSAVVGLLGTQVRGRVVSQVTLEMCRPEEESGGCTLQVDLKEALLSSVTWAEGSDAGEGGATVQVVASRETVTHHDGSNSYATSFDAAKQLASPIGAGRFAPADDTSAPLSLSLPDRGVLAVESLATGVTTRASTGGTAPGVAAPQFEPLTVTTSSGHGSVDLLSRLFTGATAPEVRITGCSEAPCTQTIALTGVRVSGMSLGSPTLTDQVKLSYRVIDWRRTDPLGTQGFAWDVARNTTP